MHVRRKRVVACNDPPDLPLESASHDGIKSNGNIFHVTGHLCEYVRNSLIAGDFPAQRPVTWSFDVSFDLRLNKRWSKQSWGWWFEAPSHPFWRHCNYWLGRTHVGTDSQTTQALLIDHTTWQHNFLFISCSPNYKLQSILNCCFGFALDAKLILQKLVMFLVLYHIWVWNRGICMCVIVHPRSHMLIVLKSNPWYNNIWLCLNVTI